MTHFWKWIKNWYLSKNEDLVSVCTMSMNVPIMFMYSIEMALQQRKIIASHNNDKWCAAHHLEKLDSSNYQKEEEIRSP